MQIVNKQELQTKMQNTYSSVRKNGETMFKKFNITYKKEFKT